MPPMFKVNTGVLTFLLWLALSSMAFFLAKGDDIGLLDVGVELFGETLPLKSGQRLYQIRGLKASASYEVKISYPASIPASFSIELRRNLQPDSLPLKNRRLLNTEKLVFKSEKNRDDLNRASFVLVRVAAAGVVAKRDVQERDLIIFNIVCDELLLGIPLDAWNVGGLAILFILIAVMAAVFLPFNLFTGDRMDDPKKMDSSKAC